MLVAVQLHAYQLFWDVRRAVPAPWRCGLCRITDLLGGRGRPFPDRWRDR